jgi:hypothetical protein
MTGKKLYVQGAADDKIFADFIDDPDVPEPTLGVAIDWVWELPWTDIKLRERSKYSKYIKFDTKGTARFTCSMFVDNKYMDADDVLDPALTMEFVGGDTPGYGGGTQPYGGGRRTSDERLWAWPCKFNIMKLRFEGSTREEIRFVAVGFYYTDGSIRR